MVLRVVVLVALTIALLGQPGEADAHKLFPATATVTFDDAGNYRIEVKTNLEALVAGIGPAHQNTDQSPRAGRYKALRKLTPEALRARFGTYAERWLAGVQVNFDGTRVRPTCGCLRSPHRKSPPAMR